METLCETLEVLASHKRAITQYSICLGMEETEQGCEQKVSFKLLFNLIYLFFFFFLIINLFYLNYSPN